jgi:hypothetical protein
LRGAESDSVGNLHTALRGEQENGILCLTHTDKIFSNIDSNIMVQHLDRVTLTHPKLLLFFRDYVRQDHAVLHIQIDGTYKLNNKKYPVLVIGFADGIHQFHPLSVSIVGSEDSFTIKACLQELIAGIEAHTDLNNVADNVTCTTCDNDGASFNALGDMFPHATLGNCCMHLLPLAFFKSEVKKQFQDNEDKANTIALFHDDISNHLLYAQTPAHFDAAVQLFEKKWTVRGEAKAVTWFRNQYLQDHRKNWAHANLPNPGSGITNSNASLECGNKKIKRFFPPSNALISVVRCLKLCGDTLRCEALIRTPPQQNPNQHAEKVAVLDIQSVVKASTHRAAHKARNFPVFWPNYSVFASRLG